MEDFSSLSSDSFRESWEKPSADDVDALST